MGPGDYHSVDASGYYELDCIWGTGPESCLFLPAQPSGPEGRRRPLVPGRSKSANRFDAALLFVRVRLGAVGSVTFPE